MTHLARYSRTTSDALRPSSSALRKTASQSSSGMRMLRCVVPLGIGGDCLGFVGGFRGADDAAVDGDRPDVCPDFEDVDEAVGGFGHVGVFADGVPVHGGSFRLVCTHTLTQCVPTPQVGVA